MIVLIKGMGTLHTVRYHKDLERQIDALKLDEPLK